MLTLIPVSLAQLCGSITAITSPLLDTSFPLAVLKIGSFVPLPLWDGL